MADTPSVPVSATEDQTRTPDDIMASLVTSLTAVLLEGVDEQPIGGTPASSILEVSSEGACSGGSVLAPEDGAASDTSEEIDVEIWSLSLPCPPTADASR